MRVHFKHFIANIKRHNFKAFLFFLCMSILVWLLVQFAKDYEEQVQLIVEIENIPLDKYLENTRKAINVDVKTSGYEVIARKIFNPKIRVEASQMDTVNSAYIYDVENHKEAISKVLNIPWKSLGVETTRLEFQYSQKSTREIPLRPNTDISFAAGFSNIDSLQLVPAKIKISGPKSTLDSITSFKTKLLRFENLKQSIQGKVKVDTANYAGIQFYDHEVEYHLEVDKFTEGEIRIPVELINVPNDIEISIFPKEVTILYQAQLNEFDNISPTDFRVVQDFNAINTSVDFFIPKITKKSNLATQVRLSETRIQYILKQ